MGVAKELSLLDVYGTLLHELDEYSYGTETEHYQLKEKLYKHLSVCYSLSVGCIALCNIGRYSSHVAIIGCYGVMHNFSLIHAYSPAGCVVEHYLDGSWV